MRSDVRNFVLEHGLDNIAGFKVTEKGISVNLRKNNMTNEEHIKELKELYDIAKKQENVFLALTILTRINAIESQPQLLPPEDPCGVADFRKQADEKADG